MTPVNWKRVKHFKKREFADDADLAHPNLIYSLDQGRELVERKMYPSRKKGSLVRYGGSVTSQHYIGPRRGEETRQSTGSDMFVRGIPIRNFHIFLGSGLFKGIGMYLDTNGNNGKPWVMFHLDVRPVSTPLTWIAFKDAGETKYVYPWDSLYYVLLRDERLYAQAG